jgi:hypothetical protein
MKWALVLWLVAPDNFTVFERFESVEQCLQKREVVLRAFEQVDSDYQAVCRPIKKGGSKANSDIVVHRYIIQAN